jgi:conjugal transfer pilus assembly protein TraU
MRRGPPNVTLGFTVVILWILLLVAPPASAIAPCHGKFANPITDICWRCLFPISIGPVKVSFGQQDAGPSPPFLCSCPAPPPLFVRFGVGVGLWEPARVAEVVRTPFCSPTLGGIQLGDFGIPAGTQKADQATDREDANYHVHWFSYPLLSWLNLLINFVCLKPEPFDLLYLTELDPLWEDDELAFLLNPEAVLFANPAAQAACAADCAAASVGFPLEPLFWCAGCQGSLYPLSGTIVHHTDGVASSLLEVQRLAAKLHRQALAHDTSSLSALCATHPSPLIRKTQYKTQMLYPLPDTTSAHPLGRSTALMAGKAFPVKGEDFSYLIFRKRLCCAF